ncbi:MAG: alpha/beta hydrolase domain-containing protein [Novosphingobium sp.]
MPKLLHLLLPLLALALTPAARAKSAEPPVRLEVTARAPAFGGQQFGTHGNYEQITGVAHLRIDPLAAANRGIVDLDLAPRAPDGLVDYDVDFVIQRPADPAKARRVMLYDVVNRGMRLLSMMTGGGFNPNDPGDGLWFRQGYTLVWSGWQGDIASKGLLGARFPIASDQGKPVTGRISTETIFDDSTRNRITLPYATAAMDQERMKVTVRAVADSPQQALAATNWKFEDDRHIIISRSAGMDAGAIYRVEYVAKDPWVMGLGFAATRDLIAWLRHAPAAQGNVLADIGSAPCERDAKGVCANPQGGAFSSAVAFGSSQSGRYLRDFLWQGFNRDLAGRRVFDGVIPFIPGARRTFTNFRFAEPGRFSRQHEDHDVSGFTFPFTYATLTDPNTGNADGVLRACSATATCPKVFHIDTSAEFWQAGAALVGTGGTNHDVMLPGNVRAYMIAGGAHAPGTTLPACRYPTNSLNYAPIVRAMLISMIDWTTNGTAPPASRWPSLARGELKTIDALKGPDVPAFAFVWPKVMNRPIPPAGKPAWPAYVPAIDADGNDVPGIRLPQVAVPNGTYVGWNLRKAGFGDGEICLLSGSYLPFAKGAASRNGDRRASLAERYPTAGDRATKLRAAAAQLQADRYLLPDDATKLLAAEAEQ